MFLTRNTAYIILRRGRVLTSQKCHASALKRVTHCVCARVPCGVTSRRIVGNNSRKSGSMARPTPAGREVDACVCVWSLTHVCKCMWVCVWRRTSNTFILCQVCVVCVCVCDIYKNVNIWEFLTFNKQGNYGIFYI